MTITAEQLDAMAVRPTRDELLQLIAIARAALAWSEADRRLTNASYSIGDCDSAQSMVSDALDGIRAVLRGTP